MKIQYINLALFALISVSCGSQYNKVKKDPNANSPYVYGEVEGPARQLKNTYGSPSPETVQKANKFREQVENQLSSGYLAN